MKAPEYHAARKELCKRNKNDIESLELIAKMDEYVSMLETFLKEIGRLHKRNSN